MKAKCEIYWNKMPSNCQECRAWYIAPCSLDFKCCFFIEWGICVWWTTRLYCLSQFNKCDLVCGCKAFSWNIRLGYSECIGGMIMDYKELMDKSREVMGTKLCKSCPVCDGKACKNTVPGPGEKGIGDVAMRNYDAWKNIRVNMDTITDNEPVNTELDLFGHTFKYPIFAGPVGAVGMHYSNAYDDNGYNDILVRGCMDAGICAFTGDGKDPNIMINATRIIKENNGYGIPTVKPWSLETYLEKLDLALNSNAFAVAMDVDAAGLPFLKGCQPPAGRMNTEQLKAIISKTPVPFIVKGVMSVKGALKAKEAGAAAIVVSNHGGRVQDQTPATAEVLEEIVKAVDGSMKIFVDGGLRNGVDIFKALAMGADAVIVARPFVNAIYGAKEAGIQVLVDKLGSELQDTMEMCGAKSLKDITRDMVR